MPLDQGPLKSMDYRSAPVFLSGPVRAWLGMSHKARTETSLSWEEFIRARGYGHLSKT